MWSKSYSMVTREVTREQVWKLVSNVNQWHTWDDTVEYAKMDEPFEKGNYFTLKPKGGPKVRIQLIETIENRRFTDLTLFPLAKMYGDHTYEDTPEGVKITITMKVEGLLGFLWRKIVAEGIADGLPSDIEKQVKAASKL